MEADAVLYGSDTKRDERYHHALLNTSHSAFGRHDYVGFDERIRDEGIVDYPYLVGHVRVLFDPCVVGIHIDLDRAFSDKRDNERYYRKYQKEYEEHRRRGRAQGLSEYEGKHQKKYVEYEPSGYPSFLFHIIITLRGFTFSGQRRRSPTVGYARLTYSACRRLSLSLEGNIRAAENVAEDVVGLFGVHACFL